MLTYHLKPNSKVFIFFIYTGTKWWRQRIITFNKTLLSKVTETHWHKEFVNYKWPKATFSAGSVKEIFLSENLQKLLQGCSSVRPQPPQTHPHTQLSKHTHTHTQLTSLCSSWHSIIIYNVSPLCSMLYRQEMMQPERRESAVSVCFCIHPQLCEVNFISMYYFHFT